MLLPPPRSTSTEILFPYTTLFRSAGVLAVLSALRQGHDPDLVLDRAVRRIGERPRVRPVAHEGRVAGLENAARGFLVVVQHAFGRDLADPGRRKIAGFDRPGVVDHDLAVVGHERAAVEADAPFQGVAGQAITIGRAQFRDSAW